MKKLIAFCLLLGVAISSLAETRAPGAFYSPEKLKEMSTLVFTGTVLKIETHEKYKVSFPTEAEVEKVFKGKLEKGEVAFKHKHPSRCLILEKEFNTPAVDQKGTFYIQDQGGTLVLIGYISTTAGTEADSLITQIQGGTPERQVAAAKRLSRLIIDGEITKHDGKVLEALKGLLLKGHGEASHEAMWALYWMGLPALDAGLEALRTDNPTAKVYGAQLLGHLARACPGESRRFGSAVAKLAKCVRNEDKFVRQSATQALAQMGPQAIPGLILALEYPLGHDDATASAAVEGLAGMGKASVPALVKALGSNDSTVRGNAAYVFYRMPQGEGAGAVPALIEATHDPVPRVRNGAANALGMIGPEAAAAATRLIEMMEQDQGDFSHSLRQVTISPEMVDEVLKLLPSYDDRSELPAVLATAGKAAAPELSAALTSDSVAVRRGAAEALAHLGSDAGSAVPALSKAVSQRDTYHAAAWALGAIGPGAEDAVPALIAGLRFDRWACPRAQMSLMHHSPAARALGKIGPSAVPKLLAGLASKEDIVQAGCVQALAVAGQGAEDRVIPAVLALLKCAQHPVVKGLAVETLLALNTPREQLLAALRPLAQDPDPRVVYWAGQAEVQAGAAHTDEEREKHLPRGEETHPPDAR